MFECAQSRRSVLKATSIAAAATFSGCAAPGASTSKSSTFVLVHGSWHGGWCYTRVAQRLRKLGHNVFTPTLTGLGERSHLLSSQVRLQTHVDDIVNVVRWENLGDIVLVGHSYGGMVFTGAAEGLKGRIRSMVYLDAFVPQNGQSLFDLSAPESRSRMEELAAKNGGVFINPFPARLFNVNAGDQAWVDAKCTPHPYATFKDSLVATGAARAIKRKIYVRSSYANVHFESNANHLRSQPDWKVIRIDSGHDMMIDKPEEVVRVLERAAA